MNEQLKKDILDYKAASRAYAAFCEECEHDRAYAVERRSTRFALHAVKLEKAENLLMTIQNNFEGSLKKMGLYEFYTECTSGTASVAILFRLADETSKLEVAE